MSADLKQVLITGGAGFIGSHLARSCLDAGLSVRVLDDFSSGSAENLAGLDIDLMVGDVCCTVTAGKACAGVDAVFHLAANPSVIASIESPLECHRVNTLGTLVLYEAAVRARAKAFVFSSSCAVYGAAKPPCAESASIEALSPYAASKRAAELFLSTMARRQTPVTALRLFNVYGERQNPNGPYAAVIAAFMRAAREEAVPVVYGDGKQTRDFVAVEDVAQAMLMAAQSKAGAPAMRILNIGTGTATSLLDLLKIIDGASGKKLLPRFEPARIGEIKHSFADVALVQQSLGWRAKTSLEQGIERLWRG